MTAAAVTGATALVSPYVGLACYTQDDAAIFFGRNAERTVLLSNLRASRLTLLYAESGVGKSSVLRAGVAARLGELAQRSFEQRGTARYIPVVFSAWPDEPTDELIAEIQRAIGPFLPEAPAPGRAPDRLDEALQAASSATDATLLVILDQFEEYFLYRSVEARNGRFADELAACINRTDLHANFLVSIREDAYSGLGDLFQGRIHNVYGNYLHLEHLTRESARQAVEKPIASYNELHPDEAPVEIEPGLVDMVLDQLRPDQVAPDQGGIGRLADRNGAERGSSEIAAPYLQLLMGRLWKTELEKGSRTLRRATLEDLGGAKMIVRRHVDQALQTLPDDDREAAAEYFHHLVTPSGTKIALAASDLAEYTGRPPTEASALLERLAQPDTRILRPVPPPPGHDTGTRFEISHDLLAPAILDWSGQRLAARLEHDKEVAQQQAANEKKRARRFRALAIVSVALLTVAIILAVAAAFARRTAQDARHQAELQAAKAQRARHQAVQQRNLAVSNQVAGESDALAGQEPYIAALLAAAAWRIHRTSQAYGSMLNAIAQPDHGVLFAGQGHNPLFAVVFSPTGKTLATAGPDRTARLWSVQTHRLIYTFRFRYTVSSVAFSPDGRTLAIGRAHGTAQLWDVATGQQVGGPLTAGPARVTAVAFRPDGKTLATADADGAVRLWNVATGSQVGHLPTTGHGRVTNVAFSPNGKILATAGADGRVRLWDVRAHRQIRAFRASRTGAVHAVAFSPDGKILATADADGTARLWDVATQRAMGAPLTVSASAVRSVAFSPDGETLATASVDGTARLWDVATRQQILGTPLTVNGIPLDSVAFSPDGRTLATAGADGTARLWNPAVYRQIGPSFAGHRAAYSVAFGQRGKILAIGGADGRARLWDVRTRHQIGVFRASRTGAVYAVTFSPDGKILATGGADGRARLWDVRTRHQIGAFRASRTGAVYAVTFSPDGKILATGGADGKRPPVGRADPPPDRRLPGVAHRRGVRGHLQPGRQDPRHRRRRRHRAAMGRGHPARGRGAIFQQLPPCGGSF